MTVKRKAVLTGIIAVAVLACIMVLPFPFGGEKDIDRGPEKAVRAYMEAWLGEDHDVRTQLEYAADCVIRKNILFIPVSGSATRDEVAAAHKEKYGEIDYEQSLEIIRCETSGELEYYRNDVSFEKIAYRWSITEEEYNAIEAFDEVIFHGISTQVREETYTEELKLVILCIKVDGRWFLLDADHIELDS